MEPRDHRYEDLIQEVHLTIFKLWREFNAQRRPFLSIPLFKLHIKWTVGDWLKKRHNTMDQQSDTESRRSHVVGLEHLDLDDEKYAHSFEPAMLFRETEGLVMRQLDSFELRVYDGLKAGQTRKEILKHLKSKNIRKYQEIVKKIRELFLKYQKT